MFLDRDVVATVSVPNGGINAATLTASTVKLYPTGSPGAPVDRSAQHVRRRRHHRRPAGGEPRSQHQLHVRGHQRPAGRHGRRLRAVHVDVHHRHASQPARYVDSVRASDAGQRADRAVHGASRSAPTASCTRPAWRATSYRWNILADGTLGPMETITSLPRRQRREPAAHRT